MSGARKRASLLGSFPVSAPFSERSPLGAHSKPSRIRLPQAASSAAAAPTLAGVAAVLCLSPQAPAAVPAAQAASHHAVVQNAFQPRPSRAQLVSVTEQAKTQRPGAGLPAWYTVRRGDSLSAIAGRFYHKPAAWPVLYWGNRGKLHWADIIEPGQVLRIPTEPAKIPGPPALLEPQPTYTPRHARPAPAAPVQAAATAASTYSGGIPGGAFGQCVVARESGGQAQIMNSTGHYGLYQFSASTWAAYGGDPADFGDASVAEQNQVFANALARGGESNWAPYDDC